MSFKPQADLHQIADRMRSGAHSLESEWRAFVGSNAPYYTSRWSEAHEGGGPFLGFNHAAGWLGPTWFAYRKMYFLSVLEVGAIVAAQVTLYRTFDATARRDAGVAVGLAFLQLLVQAIAVLLGGSFGTYWYFRSATNAVSRARDRKTSLEDRRALLREAGGTSVRMAIAVPIVAALAWAAILIAPRLTLGSAVYVCVVALLLRVAIAGLRGQSITLRGPAGTGGTFSGRAARVHGVFLLVMVLVLLYSALQAFWRH
jgi:hypothetical protein